MDEKAVVVGLEGDFAKIEVVRSKSCGSCNACTSSGGGKMIGTAKNGLNAKVGDLVRVEMADGSFLGAAVVVYMLPLGMLFLGYIIFSWLAKFINAPKEAAGVVGALVMLILAYVLVMFYDRSAKAKGKFQLSITKIIER